MGFSYLSSLALKVFGSYSPFLIISWYFCSSSQWTSSELILYLSGAPTGLLSLNSQRYSAISLSFYLIKALSFQILAFSSLVNFLIAMAAGAFYYCEDLPVVITFASSLTLDCYIGFDFPAADFFSLMI